MNPALRLSLSAIDGVSVLFDEPMSRHTTYRVGGPVGALVDVTSMGGLQATLATLCEASVPYLVVGNGSNVLFADVGYAGAVLHLSRGLDDVSLRRDVAPGVHELTVGAGLSITRLLRRVKEESLAGLECLGGVPGTVGGAVRMNAGTRLGELSETLTEVELVLPDGTRRWDPASALNLSYRHSELPEGALVVAARFRLVHASPPMWERLEAVLAHRKATQPLTVPSCGSVFANPPGDTAGRLIDAAGLKGRTVGGAQVSQQHANWIVNNGTALASDVRQLMDLCVAEVEAQFQVCLRHEVQLLGDWPAWPLSPVAPASQGGGAP